MPSTRSGASYNPSRSSQKGHRSDDTILPSNRPYTATRSLSGHIQSHPEGLQQCIAAQRVPYPCRYVEKLHEFLPNYEKTPGPSQHLQVTQWMASIYGKKEHDAFNSRMEGKQTSTTQESAKNSPSSQQQQFQCEKAATSSKQGQRQGTSHKTLQPGLQNPKDSEGCHGKCISDGQNNDEITEKGGSQIKISEMISDISDSIPELYEAITDVKTHVSDKNPSICNNIKTNSLSLSQINETLLCFEKAFRTIKTSDNENSFGNQINEQSAIIKELTDKYSKFNIDDIVETRIKQAITTIKQENKSVLENISKSFTEVKTYKIALKKSFDTSQEEISKLTIKLNQITSDNTRQTELWQELTQTEDNHKTNVINSIKILQHEFRNSQRLNNSKINDIEQLLHTLPRMSTPLNQNEGTRIPNPQVLEVENSQFKNEFSTSFHNLERSMGQALLKEVPKLKEWPHFSGEGEYDHMEFIRGIDMIKEDFELPDRLVTARFNNLFTRSAHRWYIKLIQAHGHQSWTWWKTKISNKWPNDAWGFKMETAF
ncbi:hypothetical protein O181_091372 [Austropuccinia psidii MF-1]|uniref:Retrotransposon gag domain-containing protein n=1 Tax=Austropuccinia psidii MF-1 TaxID=1389203 RepID=A0A9Q3IXE7_9BASI|nr:hypothetical protein [Austropuccinia psidii MF-1]